MTITMTMPGSAAAVDTEECLRCNRSYVRSPVDVLRLGLGALLIVAGVTLANVFDTALLGLSEDGLEAMESLPDWASDTPSIALAVLVAAAIALALGWTLATTRYRRFLILSGGLIVAVAASILTGHIIAAVIDLDVREALNIDAPFLRYSNGALVHPGDPLLAGAIAMIGIASSYLPRALTRQLVYLIGGYAIVSTIAAGLPALGLIVDIGVGLTTAAAFLLIFGRHDLAPDSDDITIALASIGVHVDDLDHLQVDARGSAPWRGTTADGKWIFVKALGRDERSADIMFRLYRWLTLRSSGDRLPHNSLRASVEHEALVSLQAAALGIRTPKILGVTDAGVDGMVLAYEAIEGSSADLVENITDDALVATWAMVRLLHENRIAHRDLRLANIFIDSEGEPWLIDFGFSELAASDQLLGTDVAELLASTAAVVGTERAVEAAHVASGLDELERALPWLQTAALSSATRSTINGNKGVEPIRRMLIDVCGVPVEEPVRLERVRGRTLFILATIGLSAWFLVPQLANVDDIWHQAKNASPGWALVAVILSFLTYAAATVSLLGAIPARIKYAGAFVAQIASSFANRVTPAKVGGLATNIRYFQRQGVPAAVSVTAVGLNAIAGLIVHVLLTVMFLLLTSQSRDTGSLTMPSGGVVVIGLAVAVGIIVISMLVPITRRLFRSQVLPQLKAGWASIKTLSHSPTRLTLLFGGSAVITLAYLGAMIASLMAYGSTAPIPVTALLFLTGSAIANAAPTPGGLGATEAALIAALSTIEEASIVIPAVFLYRLVTFWLPILPGWLALVYLRRHSQI